MKDFAQSLFRSVVPAILLVLLTGGVVLDVLISEGLEEDFDELLTAKALGLIALAEDGDDGVEMENYEVTLPSFARADNPEYFQLIADSGDVHISSTSFGFWPDTHHSFPGLDERVNQEILNLTLPDGRPGRLLRIRFVPRLDFDEDSALGFPLELDAHFLEFPGHTGEILTEQVAVTGSAPLTVERQALTLQLAIGRSSLDSLLYKVHSVLLLTGLSIMALIVLLARQGINNAVKPLRVIAAELHKIDEQRFNERLRTETSVTELHDLKQSVNVLLGRVDSAFERERRFSGDVAHELRTPLAELRTLLEVAERWPDDPEIKHSFGTDVRDVTDRMQRIVETLLQLSRSEQGNDLLVPCHDIGELVRQSVSKHDSTAKERNLTVLLHLPDRVFACDGQDQWQSIVCNLLENAIEYATEVSVVEVSLILLTADRFQFSVSNATDNLEESDLENMFERLWRKDTSRTSSLHSGLGLALVRSCAIQASARLDTTLSEGRLIITVCAAIAQPAHAENSWNPVDQDDPVAMK